MKTINSKLAVAFAAALICTAPATTALAADAASFKAAYDAAEAARKEAAKHMFEWRDTKKMLQKSKAHADKGEFDKAVKLANQAKAEGEMAVAQAKEQEEAWKAAVVK